MHVFPNEIILIKQTSAINLPKVWRSRAYFVASSSALCARPVAPAATCNGYSRCDTFTDKHIYVHILYIMCTDRQTRGWGGGWGLTGGRVLSKAPIAILKPAPSAIRTFSFGILTSSKVMPLVSEHL